MSIHPFASRTAMNQCNSIDDIREKKRQRTTEEKRIDRVMANRRSAKESRERKKKLTENLESSVQTLSNKNLALERENEKLRAELSMLMALHLQGQSMSQQAAVSPVSGTNLAHHLSGHRIPQLSQVQLLQCSPQQGLSHNPLNAFNGMNRDALTTLAAQPMTQGQDHMLVPHIAQRGARNVAENSL
eukprot:CAMPEP_0113550582 /NCGR_PEP_ID=MMETSP0015_2-20120614/14062_1 /TAXON_ID=2838 /ORGANISM="Odontella" /LENGTH=186 /DNA_ID=CAMNT_0000451405 /DNA_START=317 /DNA_END=877 /DNA_ORIENTATION=- /assembly_acc=CAM_ASM_000160